MKRRPNTLLKLLRIDIKTSKIMGYGLGVRYSLIGIARGTPVAMLYRSTPPLA